MTRASSTGKKGLWSTLEPRNDGLKLCPKIHLEDRRVCYGALETLAYSGAPKFRFLKKNLPRKKVSLG